MKIFSSITKLDRLERQLDELLPVEIEDLEEEHPIWRDIARPEQLPPIGDWLTWLYLAGRSAGKSRTGAETSIEWAEEFPGCRIALIGATHQDVMDINIMGESGIMAHSRKEFFPILNKSSGSLKWPNGSLAFSYTSVEPERLRGKQHHFGWLDETGSWIKPKDTWNMYRMGLRLPARPGWVGYKPRTFISTTPRPTELLQKIIKDEKTAITRGRTYDNAKNLAPEYIEEMRRLYAGTRLGRQELDGEMLEDCPGALWKRDWIQLVTSVPKFRKVVVAIDPAVTSGEESDETGIIVAGLGENGLYYVLADYSDKYEPNGWAAVAIKAWEFWEADLIVAEVNNGGDMVGNTIHNINKRPAYKAVRASRGKRTRAEPIAMLYEQKKVLHFCRDNDLIAFTDQLCTWDPLLSEKSPDRLDAGVWALTELSEGAIAAKIPSNYAEILKQMPRARL